MSHGKPHLSLPLKLAVIFHLGTPGDEIDEKIKEYRDEKKYLLILPLLRRHAVHEKYRKPESDERQEYIYLRIQSCLVEPYAPFKVLPKNRDTKCQDKREVKRPDKDQCPESHDHPEQKMRYRPPVQIFFQKPGIFLFHTSGYSPVVVRIEYWQPQ